MSFANRLDNFFNHLDRSFFIDNEYKGRSAYDCPLPIGFGQTISQPTLVRAMTFYLEPDRDARVLEIGTGSGYQTAFLAEFSSEVYTVEKVGELSAKAEKRLKKLGYTNIRFKVGDGSDGWPEFSPYERIIVTAAALEIPAPLLDQLTVGGIMIIPVGKMHLQELIKVRKDTKNRIRKENLGEVRFVELKGKYGWENAHRDS